MTNSYVKALALNDTYLFAGTEAGVFRSTNNGQNWNQVNSGLGNHIVNTLVLNANNIIVGTNGGIYLSTNNGINWIPKNEGFSVIPVVNSLIITNNNIYACTNGHSVWKRPLSETIYVKNISSGLPEEYNLGQNYPNPFNGTTNIDFEIIETGDYSLIIYDITGKR